MSTSSDRVAFLGPEGTFTEEALLANMPEADLHPFPYPSIRDVLKAVQSGEAPLGIVPIENSLEGSVAVTLDSLASGFDDLRIVREVTHPVHQQLDHPAGARPRADHQGHQHPARLRPVPRLHPRAPRQRGARGDRLHRRGGAPREPRRPALGGGRHAAGRGDVRVPHRRRGHRGRRGERDALRLRGARAGRAGPRRPLQDEHRLQHRPGRARQPAADPQRVRLPARQPRQDRVAAVQEGAGPLRLLHRHRGQHREPAGGAGAQVPRLQAAVDQGAGVVSRP